MKISRERIWLWGAGIAIGIISWVLVWCGNPPNMGFCIACFVRDIAGGIGMQRVPTLQYVRPEIIGLVFGSLICAIARKEFSPRAGSSPMIRFLLGFCVMIGALMFLGCPLRMVLRLAGGDLNAVVGLFGFVAGIAGGVWFLNHGFSLRRNYQVGYCEGTILPFANLILLGLLLFVPFLLFFSESGPASMHAPLWMSLAAGLVVGALAQRTRLCTVGGFRDTFLFRDPTMLHGFFAIFATVLVLNLCTSQFHLGFAGQPIAMDDGLWNFLGMVLVGFGSVLLGGCPLRQFILAGEGNSDAAVTVLGLFVGGAVAQNFGLASSAAGPTTAGMVAVVLCMVTCVVVAVCNTQKVGAMA